MREHRRVNRGRLRGRPAAEIYAPVDRLAASLTPAGQNRFAQLQQLLRWRSDDPTVVPAAVTRLIGDASSADQPRLEGLYLGLIGRLKRTETPDETASGLTQAVVDRWARPLDRPLADRLGVIVKTRPGLRRVGSLIWELLSGLEQEARAVAQFVVATSPLAPYHRLPQPRQHATAAFERQHRDLLAYLWAVGNHFGSDRVGLAHHLLGGVLTDERLTQAERAFLLAAALDFQGHHYFNGGMFAAEEVTAHIYQEVEGIFQPVAF